MYESDTILTLKEQREPDEETGEAFAYNRVRVVGPSPINHGVAGGWEGASGAGVIIQPLANFGGTLDEPLGKLQALYDVESVPVHEAPVVPVRVVNNTTAAAGPTPEEVFATEAPGTPPEEGQIRARTSPLTDPRPPANTSPLDA